MDAADFRRQLDGSKRSPDVVDVFFVGCDRRRSSVAAGRHIGVEGVVEAVEDP